MRTDSDGGPLSGVRVLEIGHFVAAPFCTRLLADLGADVVKIEPLEGDPVRGWGEQIDGRSLWWSMHGRNKRCISIDLKTPQGLEIALGLAAKSDVLVENFRPGQLDRFGLTEAALRARRPDLVIARISGFGQSGPHHDRAAFGVIGEAVGGLRHLTNHAPGVSDLPPVRVGVSIGDSVTGLYAAFGIVAALWRRQRTGAGDEIDVALADSVLSLMEGMLPEYGALGMIRQPSGGGIATAAPSNAYPTADGMWVLIAANSDALFAKLAALIGDAALADTRFSNNAQRVSHARDLDAIIGGWSIELTAAEVIARLTAADIPNSKIYTAADCAEDPQFRHRDMVLNVEDPNLGEVLHAGVTPRFRDAPGAVRWTGPDRGAHTDAVLTELLGLTSQEVSRLRSENVVR